MVEENALQRIVAKAEVRGVIIAENHPYLFQRNTIIRGNFLSRFAEVIALGNRIRRDAGISCHRLATEPTGHFLNCDPGTLPDYPSRSILIL